MGGKKRRPKQEGQPISMNWGGGVPQTAPSGGAQANRPQQNTFTQPKEYRAKPLFDDDPFAELDQHPKSKKQQRQPQGGNAGGNFAQANQPQGGRPRFGGGNQQQPINTGFQNYEEEKVQTRQVREVTENDLSDMFTQSQEHKQKRKQNDQGPGQGQEKGPYKKKFQTDYVEASQQSALQAKNKKKNEQNRGERRPQQTRDDDNDTMNQIDSSMASKKYDKKEKKRNLQNLPAFAKPSDSAFEMMISENFKNENHKPLKEKIMKYYNENMKEMHGLHQYLQNDLVLNCQTSKTDEKALDASIKLFESFEKPEEKEQSQAVLRETYLQKYPDAVISQQIQNLYVREFESGTIFDEFNLTAVEAQKQVQQSQENEERLNEKEIEDLLNEAVDPFGMVDELEQDPQNVDESKDNLFLNQITRGIDEMREIGTSKQTAKDVVVNTDQIVNQAIKKREQINLRVLEEEKKAQILAIKNQQNLKIKYQIEEEKKSVEPQDAKLQKKKDGEESSDEEIKIIITSKAEREEQQQSSKTMIQALPSKFNHAELTRTENAQILSNFVDGQSVALSRSESQVTDATMNEDEVIEQEQEEIMAIVDDEDMSNFDQLLPEANRAIVYPFEMDVFQKRAVYRLEQGDCVFVAAHTSAGKTVVAEYAIALSFKHMTKTIFTSPIKALSNQKFRDFKQRFEDVGIQTGDVSINKNATCVIMTTEILQKKVYQDSDELQDVEWVIFDEVHYIDDEDRGSVWEECIMNLPSHISIVMLSATFANYFEFANWVGRTKQKKVYVQCTYFRPVPLEHYMMSDKKMELVKEGENKFDARKAEKIISERSKVSNYQKYAPQGGQRGGQGGGQKGGKEGQKIDYKGKAIAGKQAATQKKIGAAMNGPSGQGPNSKNSGLNKYDQFFKNLKEVKDEQLLPCVVFFFSKAQVETLAQEAQDRINFIGDRERSAIKDFKKKALQRLEESDRMLPQVKTLSNLLDKGIGFHHAGMIPILKEIVEILFTDGYLKVVFATSTFAIGLNMPARSVIFTQSKKFNGERSVILSQKEYLQMAGRAGRRGQDDRGASILCIDENLGKVPGIDEYTEMFDQAGKDVESKLKMSYETNLSVLNSEGKDIDTMITNSFFSNNSQQKKVTAMKNRNKLEPKLLKLKAIDCHQQESMEEYFTLMTEINQLNQDISSMSTLKPIVNHPVTILTPEHHKKDVIVLKLIQSNQGGKIVPKYLCLLLEPVSDYRPVIKYEEDRTFEQLSVAMANRELSPYTQKLTEGIDGDWYFKYVLIQKKDVIACYNNQIIQFEIRLNAHNVFQTRSLLKQAIKSFEAASKKGLSQILPKKGKDIKQMVASRGKLIEKLDDNEFVTWEEMTYHATRFMQIKELDEELKVCNTLLSSESNEKEKEFDAKNKVLEEYKMIDEEQNMLFKGKVARIASSQADCILLTQLIFSGRLKDMNDEEILALLSVLMVDLKASKGHEMLGSKISDGFWNACLYLQQEAEKLIEIEGKFDVQDQETTWEKRLNYYFYEIIYDWAKKKSFFAIKEQFPALEEGVIIKAIQKVTSLCKTVAQICELIGDATFGERIKEAAKLLEREIMSTQSLYFQ